MQAVLALLDGAASEWTAGHLLAWIEEHLVARGLLRRPQIVREPGVTPVLLDPRLDPSASVEDLLFKVRSRVIAAVRGLIAPVADDRFLHAAIYGGRVRRATVDGRQGWAPSPREIDFLGDTVLCLLAADVLADREYYREHLYLCDLCGRVTFRDSAEARAICPEHRSSISGFTTRVV